MGIHITTGLPGASKSMHLAKTTIELCIHNRKWAEKSGKIRTVASNLPMCDRVNKEFFDTGFLRYWSEPDEIPHFRHCDVIFDEMSPYVDARSWDKIPFEIRRWFQQHRHYGVNIYGAVQEFAEIDIGVRRLTQSLTYLLKIAGSRDPSETAPPVRFIWGVVVKLAMNPKTYDENTKFDKDNWEFDGLSFITRSDTQLYDMYGTLTPSKLPPLQHRERMCVTCGHKHVQHI